MNFLSKEFIRDVRRVMELDYILSLISTVFAPIVHTHDDRYFTETESDARYSNISHNHSGVYAPIVHDHDSRYYTETETNTLLSGKQPLNASLTAIASGEILNADLPDRLQTTNTSFISSADALLETGWYSTSSTFTGSPFAGTVGANQGYLLHRQWPGTTHAVQEFYNVNSTFVHKLRRKDNGVWTPWYDNLTANNPRPSFMVTGGGTGEVVVDTVWSATTVLHGSGYASGVYTVPETGVYDFGGKFLNVYGKDMQVRLQKNGTDIDIGISTNNVGFAMINLAWIGPCTAGDTIRVMVTAAYSTNTVSVYNKFWGNRIG